MEWVETTGRTVEEAKRSALEQLGVDETDAEFEVVAEAKIGLFGRLKEEARVRARVQPRYPRSKGERRDRRRAKTSRPDQLAQAPVATAQAPVDEGGAPSTRRRGKTEDNLPRAAGQTGPRRRRRTGGTGPNMNTNEDRTGTNGADVPSAEQLSKSAEDFLKGLLREFGSRAEITSESPSDEVLEILITGEDLGMLIGPRGATLAALQEITRIVLQRQHTRSEWRVVVDVNAYRRRRAEALARFAQQVAADVLSSGKKRALEPMLPADRKVVHDAVAAIAGVSTISEGEEPHRRVVLMPVAEADAGSSPSGGTLESTLS